MIRACVLFVFLSISFSSCNTPGKWVENELVGYTQGTTYQIKYLTPKRLSYKASVDSIFQTVDRSMSTYEPNSQISRLNRGERNVQLDTHFKTVMKRSLEIAEATGGSFDPSIGPLVDIWGFGPEKSDVSEVKQVLDSTLLCVGYESISLNGGKLVMPDCYRVDLNAIAQGYTVDLVASFLKEKGIENYMVEIGGEVRAQGHNVSGKDWVIGIDKPSVEIDQQDRFQLILNLHNRSLATSGNYRKFWTDEETGLRYSHTIDPTTGVPARNQLVSVSVTAPNCMDADAYATACMVMGLEKAMLFINSIPKTQAYFVSTTLDGGWSVRMTQGFKDQIIKEVSEE